MPDSLLLYCCRGNIFKSNIRSFYSVKNDICRPLSCITENWVALYEETSTVWMMWIDAIWSRKTPPLYTVNLFDWRRTIRFHASRESQKNILVTRCLVCMRTWLFVLLFRVWFPPGQWMLYILVSFVTNSLLFHALSVIPNLPYESFSEIVDPDPKKNSLYC